MPNKWPIGLRALALTNMPSNTDEATLLLDTLVSLALGRMVNVPGKRTPHFQPAVSSVECRVSSQR